jgi:integral membrane protein
MQTLFKSKVGRLRIMGFLEGMSLLVLVFVGMPLKYFYDIPDFVKVLGPIHGALFLVFVFYAVSVSMEQKWKFKTTFIVLLSSFIPFGNFYIDKHIFSKLE